MKRPFLALLLAIFVLAPLFAEAEGAATASNSAGTVLPAAPAGKKMQKRHARRKHRRRVRKRGRAAQKPPAHPKQ